MVEGEVFIVDMKEYSVRGIWEGTELEYTEP